MNPSRVQRTIVRTLLASMALLVGVHGGVSGEEQAVFSGPQAGELLPSFSARGVYDDAADETIDVTQRAGSKPLLLVFVHQPLTRPSAAVTRGLAVYAAQHAEQLAHATVWLHEDRSEAEAYLRRARSSLQLPGLVVVSPDGAEGPGALGLNREVGLTVLIAREEKVLANFALVQPATTDGREIVQQLAMICGTPSVTQEQFDALCYGGRGDRAMRADTEIIPRRLLAPVIRRDATEQQVQAAAEAVEKFVGQDARRRRELGRIARTIVDSGKLSNYGTAAAQQNIRAWAERFGASAE